MAVAGCQCGGKSWREGYTGESGYLGNRGGKTTRGKAGEIDGDISNVGWDIVEDASVLESAGVGEIPIKEKTTLKEQSPSKGDCDLTKESLQNECDEERKTTGKRMTHTKAVSRRIVMNETNEDLLQC